MDTGETTEADHAVELAGVCLTFQLQPILSPDSMVSLTVSGASTDRHASTKTLSGKFPLKWLVSTTSRCTSPTTPRRRTAQSLPGA